MSPNSVTLIIPANTAVPSVCLSSAPAPVAHTSFRPRELSTAGTPTWAARVSASGDAMPNHLLRVDDGVEPLLTSHSRLLAVSWPRRSP
jgi:hypothetical protein